MNWVKDRATIFVLDADDRPLEVYILVMAWLEKWRENVTIADYSTEGREHIWDVSAQEVAIKELPEHVLCDSVCVFQT